MADYYTQFSVTVGPLGKAAADWLKEGLTAAAEVEDEPLGCDWEILAAPTNNPQKPTSTLWVHTTEWGNLDVLADLLRAYLQKFAPKEHIALEWGNSCNKPRPDGFGGGAMVITATKIQHMTTHMWVAETLKHLKGAGL